MPHLDLTDEEIVVLTRELTDITGNDQCPLSPRVLSSWKDQGNLAASKRHPVLE
jgi:hypothetical protein